MQETKEQIIKTNSLRAWGLAARPKTLSGAAVPVMIGIAWAIKIGGIDNFQIIPAILCLLFAFLMQIDSNLINDYFDFIKGADNKETRLGPKRACTEGWITPIVMKRGIILVSILAGLSGLPLIYYGGWTMVIVGIVCLVFAFLYTTYFSYLGLGDILVLIFFGLIPVTFTTFVILPEQFQVFHCNIILSGLACGFVIDTLLVVNNYRDREQDILAGKKTLAVRLGASKTEALYQWLGFMAYIIMFNIVGLGDKGFFHKFLIPIIIYAPYYVLHLRTLHAMRAIHQGKQLNSILALTARNIFIYGIITCIAINIA